MKYEAGSSQSTLRKSNSNGSLVPLGKLHMERLLSKEDTIETTKRIR